MSKRKPMVLLMIAVILGMVATSAMAKYFERQAGQASSRTVLTAAVDLVPGTLITKEHLKEVPWSASKVPESLITKSEDALNKYVCAMIAAGEPIPRNRLSEMGLSGSIRGYIPSGYRAMAIKVDKAVRVGGLLAPGCLVDVITVITERGYEPVSKIILQNIKVLSIGARPDDVDEKDKGKEKKPEEGAEEVVTLLVMPEEAEKLALAMTRGKIQLMARGTSDTTASVTSGSSPVNLLPEMKEPDKPKKEKPAAAAPKQQTGSAKQAAEVLYSKALSLEARGDSRAALDLYAEIAEKYSGEKITAEALKRAEVIRATAQEQERGTLIERSLASAEDVLARGMFEEARTMWAKLIDEFGSVSFKGEKVGEIVGKLKVRASTDEKKARTEFLLYKNWLQNGNIGNATVHLKKLEQNYPESTYCKQALKLAAASGMTQANAPTKTSADLESGSTKEPSDEPE